MTELTIISVSYKSKQLLEENYQLTKALNPDISFRWIVAENTPDADAAERLPMDHAFFEVIEGTTLSPLEADFFGYASCHHGKSLNKAFEHVKTDFVLTLDPDCFLFRPNWIREIIEHAQLEEIAFLGTPYHPEKRMYYRKFPTVICMLINRKLIHKPLDFRFPLEEVIVSSRNAIKRGCKREIHSRLHYFASHRKGKFFQFFLKKNRMPDLKMSDLFIILKFSLQKLFLQIAFKHYRDTGYKVYEQFASCAKHEEFVIYVKDNRSKIVGLLNFILPDSNNCFSRDSSIYTNEGSALFADFHGFGEQYFWRGELFAFHINPTWNPERRTKEDFIDHFLKWLKEYRITNYEEKDPVHF